MRHKIEDDGHSHITDLHVWSIGTNQFGVILAIVSKNPDTPETYRARLNGERFPHTTIEIVALK